MSKNKRISFPMVFILLLGLLFWGGCGPDDKNSDRQTLRVAIDAVPGRLDPRLSGSNVEYHLLHQLFEGLTIINAQGQAAPAAALRWEVAPDGRSYTFFLRPEARWSNGDPVTAADFEYAWKSVLDPKLKAATSHYLFFLKNGEAYHNGQAPAATVGVRAVNDFVLEVELEESLPHFLNLLALPSCYPVHPRTVAADQFWDLEPGSLVSNGPFTLLAWQKKTGLKLIRNDYYWDRRQVNLDQVNFAVLDAAAAVTAFEKWQVDVSLAAPPPPVLEKWIQAKQARIVPVIGTYFYIFNTQQAPFNEHKVRQAFQLAIDRSVLVTRVNQVIGGDQQPALAFIPFGFSDARAGDDFRRSGGALLRDNDLDRARQLLAEAGYPAGRGLTEITLFYNTGALHKVVAETLQEMWQHNLGVNIRLADLEWNEFLRNRRLGNYQVARHGWTGDYHDPINFLELWDTSAADKNSAGYVNAEYMALLQIARTAGDPAARMRILHEAEKMLLDDAMMIPLYFRSWPLLERSAVKNIRYDSFGGMYLKQAYLQSGKTE